MLRHLTPSENHLPFSSRLELRKIPETTSQRPQNPWFFPGKIWGKLLSLRRNFFNFAALRSGLNF
jgi:hypothetical protein